MRGLGNPSARIELVAPGALPVQWDQWPSTVQASIMRDRQPGQWHLLVTGPAAGNGYGDFIDAARAGQIASAFQPPLCYAQVHQAGFYNDAGFCPDCDAPTATATGTYPRAGSALAPTATVRAWTPTGRH